MEDLARRLKVPLFGAVGIMEMLWHFVATYTPRGDIGGSSDETIARAVAWGKKPSILIEALVESGWLDKSPEYRLIIHDWDEHADSMVRKRLLRLNQDFLPVYGVVSASVNPEPDAPRWNSYVYFIQCNGTGRIKIGRTEGDPLMRLQALQTGSAEKLTLLGYYPASRAEEAKLHRTFAEQSTGGEWFQDCPQIRQLILERCSPLAAAVSLPNGCRQSAEKFPTREAMAMARENLNGKGSPEGEPPELDIEARFAAYKARHPGVKTRNGDCRSAYTNLIVTATDALETADSMDRIHERWIQYWKATKAIPLGLFNFLAGGDCLCEPPELTAEQAEELKWA